MAGHSKWNNIKQKKGSEDKKRAKAFTKASRVITLAVKEGGSSDPATNPTLKTAFDSAKSINMPKDNIVRAISRGAVSLGEAKVSAGQAYFEVTYEGYGPSGVALIIDIVTNNKNRVAAEVKNLLGKHGGSLGEPGSASYAFSSGKPNFTVPVKDKKRLHQLLDELGELEDVVGVMHNAST